MKEKKPAFSEKSWYKDLPSENLEVCEENLHLFFQTMFERQEIWHKRFILKKERPWTKDKFFANNKFTNVYRELDRNSQWLIKNVLLENTNEKRLMGKTNRKELIWKILLYRIFNNPDTFEFIWKKKKSFEGALPSYSEYNQEEFEKLILDFRNTGENPYTNAYLINSQACPGVSRDHCYLKVVVPAIHKAIPELNKVMLTAKNPEEIIDFLETLPAVASFISHEFYQDFTYAPRYSGIKLMKFDQNDYTNVGPGAKIGLRLIFPNRKTNAELVKGICDLRDMSKDYLKKFGEFKYLGWDSKNKKYFVENNLFSDLSKHSQEMWLCEFQKYFKMKIGKGKQRSKFSPKTTKITL